MKIPEAVIRKAKYLFNKFNERNTYLYDFTYVTSFSKNE